MIKRIYFLLALVSLVACQPSPAQQTAIFAVEQAQTQTAEPTLTPTATSSPTSTPTFTPTLTPTPIGGGNGSLLFSLNPFQNTPPRENDGIYIIEVDGSNIGQFMSRAQIESLLGYSYNWAIYLSSRDRGYIFTETALHTISSDWQITDSLDLKNKFFIDFSPDGKEILYIGSNQALYISTFDGTEMRQIAVGDTRFYNAWWSADGNIIYYTRFQGRNTWAVNANGSNNHVLNLEGLTSNTPWDNFKNPELELEGVDLTLVQWPQRLDTYAVSPDKSKAAFTWQNLLFTIEANDTEFSIPHLITELPNDAHTIKWSPNGNYLLIGLRNFEAGFGDSVLVNIIDGKINTVFPSGEFEQIPCGFSPDGQQITFRFYSWSTQSSGIKLSSLNGKFSTELIQLDGQVGCPIWR